MGSKTKIQWTEATWNPVTGCSKVSEGCRFCYAERESHRFGFTKLPWIAANANTNVVCHEDRLKVPMHWKRPRMVFVNSMSDLFHENVPIKFMSKVFEVMSMTPQHTYQILTKRPKRMKTFVTAWIGGYHHDESKGLVDGCRMPLKNVWLGVSVEDQKTADERIPILLNTPSAIRWVSAEPLLGPIENMIGLHPDYETGLHWVVVGGESGRKDQQVRPMHPDWPISLRDQCVQAHIPYFFKQWGEYLPLIEIQQRANKNLDFFSLTHDPKILSFENQSMEFWRVGKKAAGRILEGRQWNDYPNLKGSEV